jgi:hypothetical protein
MDWDADTLRAAALVLIDDVELALFEPDKHRPEGLSDERWDRVKKLALDLVNGRAE